MRLDHGRLPLIAADGRLGHLDPNLVGDLELDALFAEPRDLPVDPARGDHLFVDFQVVEKTDGAPGGPDGLNVEYLTVVRANPAR